MAYLALYRKYRPRDFDSVVGQEYVTQILKNQILSDRVGHAYLLTGIRGTGKTSIAKIFARAINCQNNTDGNPCNTCDSCLNIEKPGVMDIIEIDAASNRGVDEIRDIRDKVKYPPKIGRYKVYIIDEVHMLTKEAFNALLKTLEEPPSHIVFILATTEPNKLPATILSRCQRYDIRPIAQDKIIGQMQMILADLGVSVEEEALAFIAHRGDHSMRDSLSILDQIIDIGQGKATITQGQVLDFLGMTDDDTVRKLVTAMVTGDAAQTLTVLAVLIKKGLDSTLVMGQVIEYLRAMAVVTAAGTNATDILAMGNAEVAAIKAVAQLTTPGRVFQMIEGLIEDRQKLRYNDLSTTILEMSLLKQCLGPATFATPQPEAVTGSVAAPPSTAASANRQSQARGGQAQSQGAPAASQGRSQRGQGSLSQGQKTAPRAPKKVMDLGDLPWDEDPAMADPPEPPMEELAAINAQAEPFPAQERPASSPQGNQPLGQSARAQKTPAAPPKSKSQKPAEPPKNTSGGSGSGAINTDALYKTMHNQLSPFMANMFSQGRLMDQGNGHLILGFSPEVGMAPVSFLKDEQPLLEKIAKDYGGAQVTLDIKVVEKDYEAMSFLEKTKAIVNNDRIIHTQDD